MFFELWRCFPIGLQLEFFFFCFRGDVAPPELPAHTLNVTLIGLRLLNNLATLDLKMLQVRISTSISTTDVLILQH